MAAPSSALVSVQTYQKSGLGFLLNQNCAIATANKKFKDFEKMIGQLGDTVTFDSPVQYNGTTGLVANFQGTTQLKYSLTVDQAYNVAFSFTDQNYVFNAQNYVNEFHESATMELSQYIERNVLQQSIINGPFRTYYAGISGSGTKVLDPINSRTQLAIALANYRNFGAPKGRVKMYLPDLAVPPIVGADLTKFTPSLNDEEVNSWELGNFNGADVYQSNLLPIQTAGTYGNNGIPLVVASINSAGDQITFTSTGNADTIKAGDILTFDSAALRFLTYIGHAPTGQAVQVRATADATATSGGGIVVQFTPALISDASKPACNINMAIQSGMTVTVLPSHRCGVIVGGNAFYLAMPQLPDEDPFATSHEIDPETGCSLRVYYGSKFGENERGYVVDQIWGSLMVPIYCERLAFPLGT